MSDSFYVELSSNSSGEGNTLANFRNKIELFRILDGKWEVGLVEMSYTKSWSNLRRSFKVKFITLHHQPNVTIVQDFKENVSYDANTYGYYPVIGGRLGIVRSGYYETAMDLCKEIEKEYLDFRNTKDVVSLPKFHFDEITNLIYIDPGRTKDGGLLVPDLTSEVSGILGFDEYFSFNSDVNQTKLLIPDRPADINTSLKSLFIYSNIVEPQYIGDTRAKLLRSVVVPADAKFGHQVVVNYDSPHYIPLLTNEFDHILINIRDDTNETIPFMFGRTRVKLHFRRKND